MEKNKKKFNLGIIGAGPAGLSASIYASRYNISHIIIGQLLGGQISETHSLDNYPGIEDISGFEFSQKLGRHAKKYGVQIISQKVRKIKKEEAFFRIILENKEEIITKFILLATGTKRRKLNVKGEEKFLGKGVSYCATCDGFFYKEKNVGVIGGGNSAVVSALYLADICNKVCIIYRGEKLRSEPFWIEKIQKNPKIEIIFENNVKEFLGKEKLEKIILEKPYQGEREINLEGVFVEIGSYPEISYASDLGIISDEEGYIKIQKNGETNVSRVFSAGDITNGSNKFRQVVTAVAEGAIATEGIFEQMEKQK
ncbi:MAG: hypothetical protein COZ85_03715 [Candidatus Moranbacteria bacterium CG_4_8_14_3_um_filter_34_16]|nr:MAG: hypothetical protein COT31_02460 [Candidatus Moranbacteria bacterium CG08_land_8_20_14_0_20_34_16]PIW94732.1 MAG: hypothetical protein COZ85_03715 [Candidatus Moranbacteria bacterium CG_4_8_14_3_um_filter_34_16]